MAGKSFAVAVKPAVLRWARESAGYSLAEAAERCGKSEEQLAAWESGKKRPKWSVLGKLATTYRRPVACFLLPAPPEESPPPPDFRTLPGAKGHFSPSTRLAIRTARWLLSRADELEQELEKGTSPRLPKVSVSEDPEKAARAFRQHIGVTAAEQTNWQTVWQALKSWRSAVEAQRVFVFQFRMPVEEARGFSLFEARRPAIVLNQRDAPSARIFTLFHECAHLLLSQPGICTPEEAGSNHSPHIETFCNRFSAALLIPREDLKDQIPSEYDDEAFESLARRYRVSRYVVLGRMHSLGVVSSQQYQQFFQRWHRRQAAAIGAPRAQKGGLNAAARCLSEKGRAFVSLVVRAAKREIITINEATAYLGTKLRVFRKLASKGA